MGVIIYTPVSLEGGGQEGRKGDSCVFSRGRRVGRRWDTCVFGEEGAGIPVNLEEEGRKGVGCNL